MKHERKFVVLDEYAKEIAKITEDELRTVLLYRFDGSYEEVFWYRMDRMKY